MVKYSFRQCTLTLLDRLFGLRQTFASQSLQDWVTTDVALSGSEQGLLQALRSLLTVNAPGWNEQELALQFIGPLFSFVNFTEPYRFNLFADKSKIRVHLRLSVYDLSISQQRGRCRDSPMFPA